MQKRHFEALARALQRAKPAPTTSPNQSGLNAAALATWEQVVLSVATMAGSTNPLFKRERFLAACGLNTERSMR